MILRGVVMNDINKIQDKTNDKQSDSLLASNARRRLIKGSAVAVPIVMTLRSGAAMAASSTESCIARDQKLADSLNPKKFTNSNPDPFLRTEITITRLIKIKKQTDNAGQNPKWVFDKKSTANADGTFFKYRTVYAHGHGLTLFPSVWLNTGDPQLQFSDQGTTIDVFDSYADPAPAITGKKHFKRGSNNFVQDTSFGSNGLKEKYGLVVTDPFGNIQDDGFGPRVGRSVDHADLQANNHLTGSCWSSLNPNVP